MPAPSPQQTKLGRLLQLLLTREGGEESKVPKGSRRPLRATPAQAGLGISLPVLPISTMALLCPLTPLPPSALTSPLFSSAHFLSCPKNTQPPLCLT